MRNDYPRYHFSATFRTNDLAVLHCLRALNQWAQRGESGQNIGWGGTTEEAWQRSNSHATVRFTSVERRTE